MSPRIAAYNHEKCGNVARLFTETMNWPRDRFIATGFMEGASVRRYGKTADIAETIARKAGGHGIRVYDSQLKCRVR